MNLFSAVYLDMCKSPSAFGTYVVISMCSQFVLLSVDGEDIFRPYQFKMEEIEGLRYRSKVSNSACILCTCKFMILIHNSKTLSCMNVNI